jgi:hypothetical protein
LFVRHRSNWGLLTRFSMVGGAGMIVNLLVFGLQSGGMDRMSASETDS